MTEAAPIYVDANVFIYAFEKGHRPSFDLFATAGRFRPARLYTSVLSKAELLVRPIREGSSDLIHLYSSWTDENEALEVIPVSRNIAKRSAELRAAHHPIKLPDAIHLATAFSERCAWFVSFDTKLEKALQPPSAASDTISPIYVNPDSTNFPRMLEEIAA